MKIKWYKIKSYTDSLHFSFFIDDRQILCYIDFQNLSIKIPEQFACSLEELYYQESSGARYKIDSGEDLSARRSNQFRSNWSNLGCQLQRCFKIQILLKFLIISKLTRDHFLRKFCIKKQTNRGARKCLTLVYVNLVPEIFNDFLRFVRSDRFVCARAHAQSPRWSS